MNQTMRLNRIVIFSKVKFYQLKGLYINISSEAFDIHANFSTEA